MNDPQYIHQPVWDERHNCWRVNTAIPIPEYISVGFDFDKRVATLSHKTHLGILSNFLCQRGLTLKRAVEIFTDECKAKGIDHL